MRPITLLTPQIAYSNKEQDAKEEEKKSRPNRESTINSTRPVDPNSIQISVDADNGSESGESPGSVVMLAAHRGCVVITIHLTSIISSQ